MEVNGINRNNKIVRVTFVILSISLIASCANHNDTHPSAGIESSPATTLESTDTSATPTNSPSTSDKQQLVTITEYAGQESTTMKINEKTEKAIWVSTPYSDFGFYVPPQIKVVKGVEGYSFRTQDGAARIKILSSDLMVIQDDNKLIDNELNKYSEYISSNQYSNVRQSDYFKIEYLGSIGIVTLTYPIERKEEILPIFIEIMKSIQYKTEEFRSEQYNSPPYSETEHG